jgi:hypothetical protein
LLGRSALPTVKRLGRRLPLEVIKWATESMSVALFYPNNSNSSMRMPMFFGYWLFTLLPPFIDASLTSITILAKLLLHVLRCWPMLLLVERAIEDETAKLSPFSLVGAVASTFGALAQIVRVVAG